MHRDLCVANVVQLGPLAYMVIDLETAGRQKAEPLEDDFLLSGWTPKP